MYVYNYVELTLIFAGKSFHKYHIYTAYHLYVCMWSLILSSAIIFQEGLLHIPHSYGFSHVWIFSCLVKLLLAENVFLHVSHSNGLSPLRIFCHHKKNTHSLQNQLIKWSKEIKSNNLCYCKVEKGKNIWWAI